MLYLNGCEPKKVKTIHNVANEELQIVKNVIRKSLNEAFGLDENGKVIRGNVANAAAQYGEFIARETSYFMPELLLAKYPDLVFRDHIPVISQGGFSSTVVSRINDYTGEGQTQAPVVNGVQMVDMFTKDRVDTVVENVLGMGWDYSELMQTKQMNANFVEQTKLAAVRRGHERFFNDLALFGDEAKAKFGLLTDTAITRVTAAPTGTGGSTRWATKTPEQIIEDIRSAYVQVNTDSKGVFNVNNISLSRRAYNQINAKLRNDFTNLTIDAYARDFLTTLQTIVPDSYMDEQGAIDPLTTLPTDVAVFMDRSQENFFVNNTVEMTATPVNYTGTKMVLPFLSRSSGFILRRAPSILILEGI